MTEKHLNTILNTTQLTISSREIAEITGKEHFNVLRDIDKTIKSLNSELSLGFKSNTYKDSTGKENREFLLDRDSAYCLMAGYDATARMNAAFR